MVTINDRLFNGSQWSGQAIDTPYKGALGDIKDFVSKGFKNKVATLFLKN